VSQAVLAGPRHPDVSAAAAKGPRRRRRIESAQAVASVLPALATVALFMLLPIGYALWLSFHNTDGVTSTFVGADNYVNLLQDPVVHAVFVVNLKYLLAVPLVLVSATLCAVLLYEQIWGWRLFRVLFFVPSVLSTAVIGLMFKGLFGYDGPVNATLQAAGLDRLDFFTKAGTAIGVIILALVWSGFGYATLILLSGLSAIDPELLAAARVDGAGWWKRLFYVTVPNIRRSLAFVTLLNVIYTFTSLFAFVFVMTAGGPGYSTTTLDYLIYQRAFSTGDFGAGSALAIMVFLLIGVLTVVQMRLFRLSED